MNPPQCDAVALPGLRDAFPCEDGAELPHKLVNRFGRDLVELSLPGYPRGVSIDVAWSRDRPRALLGNGWWRSYGLRRASAYKRYETGKRRWKS